MEKKDIYEHLAKIYLDASLKRKKKAKESTRVFRNLFLGSSAAIFILVFSLVFNFSRNKGLKAETALVLQPDAVKINFHFDPAKKEFYSLALNNLDLGRYKTLAFSAKKADYKDNLALKIEFINVFKEKSELYLRNLSHKWGDYKISLGEFKNLSDWSSMINLGFVVEEWNAKEKRGIVYLDNIRFLK